MLKIDLAYIYFSKGITPRASVRSSDKLRRDDSTHTRNMKKGEAWRGKANAKGSEANPGAQKT